MSNSPLIRHAKPEEAAVLSRLAMQSKASWGYSDEFMEACREELSVSPDEIAADGAEVVVSESGGEITGFFVLQQLPDAEFELEALFVDPAHAGKGLGRLLLDHALCSVRKAGGEHLTIQSDPNAAGFYLAAGARQSGTRESGSIPGRFLPLLEIEVGGPDADTA